MDNATAVPQPQQPFDGYLPDRVVLDKVFVSCLVVLISVANILMGCELDLSVVFSTLKRPFAPAIGFFTQFFVMPMLAFVIAKTVLSGRGMELLALGLFITGCSPGGGASNYWTLLLDGNAHLSVTMTFFSTVAAFAMMPFWMNLLGADLVKAIPKTSPKSAVLVPYGKIVGSLFSLVLPLLIGILIARLRPNWAANARKVMRPFIAFVLVFVVVFGILINFWLFRLITWPILLAGLLLPWCGFMFGCFTSILMRQSPPNVVAIAVETGVQNTGIAIMVLKLSFPGTQSDIASLLPICVACFTPGPLLLGYAIHRALRRLQQTKGAEEETNKTDLQLADAEEGLMGADKKRLSKDRVGPQQLLLLRRPDAPLLIDAIGRKVLIEGQTESVLGQQ